MTNWTDPKFELAIESNGIKFYRLKNISDYHVSRFLAASANDRYASLGLTEKILEQIETKILEATEAKKWDEIAVWVHHLKARRSNPVDEFAAIRMASIYHFLEDENPDKTEASFTDMKFDFIQNDPVLFSFFLPIGLQFTPSYMNYLNEITQTSLEQRKEILKSLQPQN